MYAVDTEDSCCTTCSFSGCATTTVRGVVDGLMGIGLVQPDEHTGMWGTRCCDYIHQKGYRSPWAFYSYY